MSVCVSVGVVSTFNIHLGPVVRCCFNTHPKCEKINILYKFVSTVKKLCVTGRALAASTDLMPVGSLIWFTLIEQGSNSTKTYCRKTPPVKALALSCWAPAATQQWPSASVSSAHPAAPQVLSDTKKTLPLLRPRFLALSSPTGTCYTVVISMAADEQAENHQMDRSHAASCCRLKDSSASHAIWTTHQERTKDAASAVLSSVVVV